MEVSSPTGPSSLLTSGNIQLQTAIVKQKRFHVFITKHNLAHFYIL